jgi:hypothetical protein
MTTVSRRHFLQTTAAAVASMGVARRLPAHTPDSTYWFVHADDGDIWPVADPVAWSLEHARHPVLERAAKGLLNLTAMDGDRIIRLVVRRARLNLVEVCPGRLVVHHWGRQGLADLRPWFKFGTYRVGSWRIWTQMPAPAS